MASPLPSIPSHNEPSTTSISYNTPTTSHHPTISSTSLASTSSSQSSTSPPSTPPVNTASTTRPHASPRKPSASNVVPSTHPHLEIQACDESFDSDDARTMSPRRSSEDIERMGREAREEFKVHAQTLQTSLLAIFARIEAVREEHDKLDSNNRFLQQYIGDLMSTSKITAGGGAGGGGGSAGGGGGSGRKK